MLPEKTDNQLPQQNQQVVVISNITDFNSAAIKEQIEKVQQEVKSVMEGAIIDSSKLSYNFTV